MKVKVSLPISNQYSPIFAFYSCSKCQKKPEFSYAFRGNFKSAFADLKWVKSLEESEKYLGKVNGFDYSEASWMKLVCKVCQSCQLQFASTRISLTTDLRVIPNFLCSFLLYMGVLGKLDLKWYLRSPLRIRNYCFITRTFLFNLLFKFDIMHLVCKYANPNGLNQNIYDKLYNFKCKYC